MAKKDVPEAEAIDVSWWAETADGCCDEENLVIVKTNNGRVEIRKETDATENDEHLVLIRKNAGAEPPRKRVNIGVLLEGAWYEFPKIDGASCDAFFATKSAARKFVFPYYEAHRLLTPKQMQKLKAKWDEDVLGIGHYPPSRSLMLKKPGEEGHYETAFVVKKARGMEQPFLLQALSEYALSLEEPGGEKGSK